MVTRTRLPRNIRNTTRQSVDNEAEKVFGELKESDEHTERLVQKGRRLRESAEVD